MEKIIAGCFLVTLAMGCGSECSTSHDMGPDIVNDMGPVCLEVVNCIPSLCQVYVEPGCCVSFLTDGGSCGLPDMYK